MRVGRFLPLDFLRLLVQVHPADNAHQNQREDDAHHTQRIGTGITHGNLRTGITDLGQGFIGGTKTRRIRHGTAKNTHHHGQLDAPLQDVVHQDCHRDVQRNDTRRQQVHPHPALLEGREERRTHLKTDTKHKQN